jgi:large subunit ribosomal protein L18
MSKNANEARKRRQRRIRNRISGTPERPRLNVYRSIEHIYAQLIDDVAGRTLVSASTIDTEVVSQVAGKKKKEQAAIVGKVVARRALDAGIQEVVFDRGGYLYHGRVKAVAEGAREGGLKL